MKHLKNLCILILFSSCASIPDTWVCRARSVNQGFCTKTISQEEKIVDDSNTIYGKTWIDLKIESVYVPVESWGEIKKYIVDQCKKRQDCSNDIGTWTSKIDSLNPTLHN